MSVRMPILILIVVLVFVLASGCIPGLRSLVTLVNMIIRIRRNTSIHDTKITISISTREYQCSR